MIPKDQRGVLRSAWSASIKRLNVPASSTSLKFDFTLTPFNRIIYNLITPSLIMPPKISAVILSSLSGY